MNKIQISDDKVSFCHKNNCIDVKGSLTKVVAFSAALFIVISGIASLTESSK